MRPDLTTLARWSPSDMAAEARRLTAGAQQLEVLANALVRDFDAHTAAWVGSAADQARERVIEERRAWLTLARDWTEAARALEHGALTIADLRARVLDRVASARAEGLHVDARGGVRVGFGGLNLAEWVGKLWSARLHGAAITDGLAAIDVADQQTATAFAAALGAGDPAGLVAAAQDAQGELPGEPGGDAFVLGPPTRPDITWDEDYEWGSADATPGDYASAAEWRAKMAGARLLRPDLDDALDAYGHYWSNTGDRFHIDYEEAYREDASIAANVEEEIARAAAGADRLVQAGNRDFAMSGDATSTAHYPTTENWQKAIGGYQQWSSADVVVDGSTVTMEVTVHAEDYYNFNKGQADIASGAPDDENGRFTEVGWAKPFPTSGQVTRTVTWPVGHPEAATVAPPAEAGSR